MDLGPGRRGEYAVRLAIELARRWPDGRVKARTLSETTSTPRSYAAHVLGDLVHSGLVISSAGPAGGYALARDPRAVSLLEVVEAAGANAWTPRCLLAEGPCSPERRCAVHDSWHGARRAFTQQLATTDLAGLLRAETEEATT